MTAASEWSAQRGEIERVERQAVDWLTLLQDDPDSHDARAGFEAWVTADPAHAAAWADMRLTAGLIDFVPPAHIGAWENWRQDKAQPRRARGRRNGLDTQRMKGVSRRVLVAGLATAACLVVLIAPTASLHLRANYISGAGELQTVTMDDGSEIHLAPQSAVRLDQADGRRGVELLRGQAYFEVRSDPARRFVVESGDVRTTVLGTGFEVVRHGEGADVAVRHGLVQVDDENITQPPARLTAGDRISIADDKSVRSRERPDRIGAWTQGDLIVADRSGKDVIDLIRPWKRGVILTTGGGLDARRVTGVYDLHDPEAALVALAAVHDLKIREITPWITVVSTR